MVFVLHHHCCATPLWYLSISCNQGWDVTFLCFNLSRNFCQKLWDGCFCHCFDFKYNEWNYSVCYNSRVQPWFKNWGFIFPSRSYKRPTTAVKGVDGRGELGRGKGWPLPSRLGVWGSVIVSYPSRVWGGTPAANDFGAFHVQFYAISCNI